MVRLSGDQVARVTTARDTDTERDLLGDRVYANDDCPLATLLDGLDIMAKWIS